ncbi:tyrosine-type recombinase/integrase [Altererythrobacter sediminis]|uniref:Tyrosine-type recombinase/integrase n=2 Tax=Allopontixanthobacter sediminis TaxID=1689985 RepID=A0A845AZT4_9SPHN|nr:tyrosine-type recombinase/integrase [Allopontixanthobacter sediminis]
MHITNPGLLDYRAKRRGEGLQAHSVNRDFAYLKAALRHAQQIHGQQIPSLAWKELRAKEPDGRTRFLSRDEYDRLLAVCGKELSLIVKVAVSTGLRKNNLLQLDWKEVDLSSGMITVTIKGNKRHTIRMPANIRAALSTRPERKGKVFDTTNFRKDWEAAVRKSALANFRFHDLRHTCATWMRMAGVDIADICDALGHSSVTVTMRYAHIEPDEHVSPFDRISERVWSQSAAHSPEEVQTSAIKH